MFRPLAQLMWISIHAPREGGDVWIVSDIYLIQIFQSTPPARGATTPQERTKFIHSISIHAPREGGDTDQMVRSGSILNFNPRPPRGGRRDTKHRQKHNDKISIHAPREGGDFMIS